MDKMMSKMVLLLVSVLFMMFAVSEGQDVVAVVKPTVYFKQGTSAAITCSYTVTDASYNFDYIAWGRSSTDGSYDTANNVAAFLNGLPTPSYPGGPRYTMSTDTIQTSNVLTIASLNFTSDDNDRYWCVPQFKKTGLTPIDDEESSLLIVVVSINSASMFNASGGTPVFTNGSVVKLSSDVSEHIITCEVQDINPEATFTWTLDGNPVDSGLISNPVHVVGADGLTTSSSNVTLEPKQEYDGQELKCKAVNYEDDPGVMISVTLSVDPCDPNPCDNGGTCSVMSDGITATCECPTGFEKPLCKAATTTGIPETSTKLGVTSTEPSGDGTTTESSTGSTTSETSSFSTTEEKSPEPTTTDQPPDLSNTTNSATTTDGVLASSTAEELTTSDPGIDDPGAPGGLSVGAIAGIVIGAVAAVALVIGIGVFIHSKHPGAAVKPAVVDGSHDELSNGDAVRGVKKKEDG